MTDQAEQDSYLNLLSASLAPKSGTDPSFTVAQLLANGKHLSLSIVAGREGLDRCLTTPKVQLLGLALAGFTDDLEPGSAQVLGRAELRFIQERMHAGLAFLAPDFQCDFPCFLVPENLEIPDAFAAKADRLRIPVLRSPKSRLSLENGVARILEQELAPSTSFHGVLVVVCGLGILILGKSGIGKSDCALDLITHGHQLVADDIVSVRHNSLGQLIGRPKGNVRHHMDIRGLGIINVKELFSIYSVMDEHAIDMVIYLEPWDKTKSYVISGGEESLEILGAKRPMYRMPVSSGRNWVNLIQVAVRRHILQCEGVSAEKALVEQFGARLKRPDGL